MLFIHAGTGKTGTTYLQNILSANSDKLGFIYPTIGRASKTKSLLSGHHRLALNYQGANSKNEWLSLIHHLKENKILSGQNWVVSTENLTYASAQLLEWISSSLDNHGIDHRYILFVRDTESYALSSFLEYVKVGRVPLYFSIDDFLDDHINSMLVDNLIRKFANASGNRLTLIDYNRSREEGSLLHDFLKSIGFLLSSDQLISPSSNIGRNPSLYPELACFFSSLTSVIMHESAKKTSTTQVLEQYKQEIETGIAESSSFIESSPTLKRLITESIDHARINNSDDYILAPLANGLVHEFNKSWDLSQIRLRASQADSTNIRASDYYPKLTASTHSTHLLLQSLAGSISH
jgi:hypothetical protein